MERLDKCPLKRATKDACSNVAVSNSAECKDYYAEKVKGQFYACRARTGAFEWMASSGKCKVGPTQCEGPSTGSGLLVKQRVAAVKKDPSKFKCADLKKGDILVLNFDGNVPLKYKHAVTVLGFSGSSCDAVVKTEGVKALYETAGYTNPTQAQEEEMGGITPNACVFSASGVKAATISPYSCDPDIRPYPEVAGESWSNDRVAKVLRYEGEKREEVIRDVARVAAVWVNYVSEDAKNERSFTKSGAFKSAFMSNCLGNDFAALRPYAVAASEVLGDIIDDSGQVTGMNQANYWPKRGTRAINMFCSKVVAAVWGGVLRLYELQRNGPARPEACLPSTLLGLSTNNGRLRGKWSTFDINGWWAS